MCILSLGFIYANDLNSVESPDDDGHEVNVENESDLKNCKTSEDISDDVSNSTANIPDSNTQNNSLVTYDEAYEKSTIEYSPINSEYTSGYMTYKIRVYSVLNFNGTQYRDYNNYSVIKLNVYSGNVCRSYTSNIDDNGVALIRVANLSLGKHTVEIFADGKKGAKSYINIIKSTTIVYAPDKTLKYKKNNYYKIKVLDSHKNYLKNTGIKVSVYTGKKSKTYSLKTDSKGVAKLDTSRLSLGTHKVVIKSGDKKYKISKTSKVTVKKTVHKKALKLKASAPAKTVKYKANDCLKITLTNDYGNVVKNIQLKVNVYTGKKVKTYTVKTNSKGVAKLKTNNLSVGNYKVTVKSADSNYKVSKNSKINVKKNIKIAAGPVVLKSLKYYPVNGSYHVKLTWNAKVGSTYQVLRKTNDSFAFLAQVKSDSREMMFCDDVDGKTLYTYAVREVIDSKDVKVLGPYDKEGLRMLDCPNVTVDFQNLKAEIQWDKIDGATKYLIFRKAGHDGQFTSIASVADNVLSYTDVYHKTQEAFVGRMNANTFIDPSYNDIFYTVRACTVNHVNGITKKSYGLYLEDGDFHLESPSIVSLNDKCITWGRVPNAEGYLILKRGNESDEWETIGNAEQDDSAVISLKLDEIYKESYYSVKAFAHKNGKIAYSDYDRGFSLKNFSQDNSVHRILYFGDSITYGSPYKSHETRHIFSIPHRVAQLLGCTYYNPSIPGSTYHDLGQNEGVNIENTNYYRYRICREVVDPISVGMLPGNWKNLDTSKNSEGIENTSIEDYNIVVLAAGTNDYLDNTIRGDINSTDTSTFNGAFNHIMDKIENASRTRIDRGESPIKVVFVDLYYSDRAYHPKLITNRDVTPNTIGLTLMDYQEQLNSQFNKWNDSEYLTLYKFKTRDYNIVNEKNCPYTASDNLHFTKYVYGQYGNAFADFLLNNVF